MRNFEVKGYNIHETLIFKLPSYKNVIRIILHRSSTGFDVVVVVVVFLVNKHLGNEYFTVE